MNHTEDNFTPPSELCPHPELWTANNAGATELEVQALFYGLVRGLQPEYVVEFGTYQGEMAETIGKALRENGHGRLTTVERDKVSLDMAMQRIETSLPVTFIQADVRVYDLDLDIDMAWIDAGVDGVRAVDRIFKYFRRGSVIGIHDSHQEQIKDALSDSLFWDRVRNIELRTPRGLYLCEVI